MTAVALAVGAATLVTGIYSSNQQKKAADQAAGVQTQAADKSIEEQRRQFDAIQKLLSPYVDAGSRAVTDQQTLLGLNGPEAQQKAIAAIQQGPQFGAMVQQGENALLQNASATGGLRGGNTQAALAQFRPQILSQLIEQQYGRLGGIATLGQASAAGQAAQAQRLGESLSGQFGQIGAAQAGAELAGGAANAQLAGTFGSVLGQGIGAYMLGQGGQGGAGTPLPLGGATAPGRF